MQIKVVGMLAIKGKDQIRRVYDTGGVSPTLATMGGGNQQPKIIEVKNMEVIKSDKMRENDKEPFIVASRGRGKDWEQHLEPRRDGMTNTITSAQKDNFVAIKVANKKGYEEAFDGDGIDIAYPHSQTRRGRVGHGISKTIQCVDIQATLSNARIRKLTPKECWRLMGFDDSDFEKAAKVNSNAQLYKQAGNSIVVNVLEAILGNLLCK